MKWRALGRIFETDAWAQTPTPLVLDDRVRVYFAERQRNETRICFVDIDIGDPERLISERQKRGPVLAESANGTFDSCGQMPSCAVKNGLGIDLYYSGWLAPAGYMPYHNATGLAHSLDWGQTFTRAHRGPILDRTATEPWLAVTPCVVGGDMWYISGLGWELVNARYEPVYGIAHAYRGTDGEWKRNGKIVIPSKSGDECFSRPWVMQLPGPTWAMWYCYRKMLDYRDGLNAYRIGYATSPNGVAWTRRDDEIEIKRGDWDSKMSCYPAVFEAKGKMWMLFNGDTFGKNGFGIAVAE